MVSNSKILTVSYGTFSCTLEGFDDSFDTMKAIAEYFRDLAADDRYFGAEPPSPDAEMLARIAEREISRRVEARGTNGAYHLKADPSALTSQPAAQDPAPESTPQDTAAPAAETAAESATIADAPAPTARSAAPASESIADKLRRIRAVAAPAGSGVPGFDEDEHAQDFLASTPDDETREEDALLGTPRDPEPEFEPEQEPEAESLLSAPEALTPDQDEAEQDEDDLSDETQSDVAERKEEMPEADQSADIEAEFEPEADAEPQPAIAADADTDVYTDADDTPLDSSEYGILARLSEEDGAEDVAGAEPMPKEAHAPIEASDESDDFKAMLRASEADADTGFEIEEDINSAETAELSAEDDDYAEDDSEYDDDDNIFGEDDDSDAGDESDTLAQLLADAMTPDEADRADALAGEKAAKSRSDDQSAEAERPLAARVFKMKRDDLDAALAGGDFEDETEETPGASSLSAEAEAELQRELAEVEAELHNTRAPETALDAVRPDADMAEELADDEADEQDEEEAARAADEAKSAKHFATPAPDAQAARIFDEADSQLEEPASNERRSAIQHLRAAVAATRAERRAGGAMQADVDDKPYRDDLQTAVRPRRQRPMASGATPRPSAAAPTRPAPLKLVAEQRVDTNAAPVRPRRITRADLASATAEAKHPEAEDAPEFAVFAEQMGASSLTEMLEAAAAYMADVEGMPQFSRPMLMQKLREAQEEEFSREDGLRSFGQLLRQGKLQKLKGGRFAVTSVTEFRQSA